MVPKRNEKAEEAIYRAGLSREEHIGTTVPRYEQKKALCTRVSLRAVELDGRSEGQCE